MRQIVAIIKVQLDERVVSTFCVGVDLVPAQKKLITKVLPYDMLRYKTTHSGTLYYSVFHVSTILKPTCAIPTSLNPIDSCSPEIVKSFRYWSFPCSFCDRSGWTAFDELLQNGDQAISNDTEYDKNNFIVTEATMEAAMLHPLGDVLNHNEEIDDSDEETNLVV